MLKNQPMVNQDMPGFTPQMFNQVGGSSPLGASVGNGNRNMGPIGNSQSVNFQGFGIGQGLPRGGGQARGWGGSNSGNQADGWNGNDGGVVQNYPGSGAFRGALHNPHEISDPRQMGSNSFDQNRQSFQSGGGAQAKIPIDYVGFNAQGEKVYDAQYYQKTPGRHNTEEFYAKYKKTPNQQILPGNTDQNSDSFMGYEPPVNHQQAQAQAQEYSTRMMNPGHLTKAPLNQRNLRNFQGQGRGIGQGRGMGQAIQGGKVRR
jgi:hypothetical protein